MGVCAQSCLALCNPMDYTLPGSSVQQCLILSAISYPISNTGVGCHFLFQGFFLTQGSNPSLLHGMQMFSPSEPPGKMKK